jgi:ketopantoate reductase
MNERIEKLVIEAFFDESTNGADQKMYTLGEEKIQKFAELIVRECGNVAWKCGSEFIDNEIKKHFGVSE